MGKTLGEKPTKHMFLEFKKGKVIYALPDTRSSEQMLLEFKIALSTWSALIFAVVVRSVSWQAGWLPAAPHQGFRNLALSHSASRSVWAAPTQMSGVPGSPVSVSVRVTCFLTGIWAHLRLAPGEAALLSYQFWTVLFSLNFFPPIKSLL